MVIPITKSILLLLFLLINLILKKWCFYFFKFLIVMHSLSTNNLRPRQLLFMYYLINKQTRTMLSRFVSFLCGTLAETLDTGIQREVIDSSTGFLRSFRLVVAIECQHILMIFQSALIKMFISSKLFV